MEPFLIGCFLRPTRIDASSVVSHGLVAHCFLAPNKVAPFDCTLFAHLSTSNGSSGSTARVHQCSDPPRACFEGGTSSQILWVAAKDPMAGTDGENMFVKKHQAAPSTAALPCVLPQHEVSIAVLLRSLRSGP